MSKKKKIKKPKEKTLDESNKKETTAEEVKAKRDVLAEQIEKATAGLYYVSETDAEIRLFVGGKSATVSKAEILAQTENADTPVEERNFAEFFERLTKTEDWFGEEETETARKFVELKRVLENNIRDLKVFKIGKIQLDVYVVGLDAEDRLIGVQMKAVET